MHGRAADVDAAVADGRRDRDAARDNLRIDRRQPLAQALVGNADDVPEALLAKLASAAAKHFLGRVVGFDDIVILVEQQDREDQRGELSARIGCAGECAHAARRRRKGS